MLVDALRSREQLREHYAIERELADRLRHAPRAARNDLYPLVYDELFRRVPHHPQLARRSDPGEAERRRRKVEEQARFLRRFVGPRKVFAELGAGDCSLSLALSPFVERVYAVEVSETITKGLALPPNFRLVLADGPRLPLASASVDFAFSDQLMEHLHPEDAAEQLAEVARTLKPGGRYFCVTPNRLYGPSDISWFFDEEATGLHLKEYSAGELRRLFLASGFREVRFYAGARRWFIPVPYALLAAAESVLGALPARLRRGLAKLAPLRALLGVRVLGIK